MSAQNDLQDEKFDLKVCVIPGVLPTRLADADAIHITNLVKIIQSCVREVTVCGVNTSALIPKISGIQVTDIPDTASTSIFARLFKFSLNQIRISNYLINNRKGIDVVFLAIGSGCFLLPTIIAKVLRKKVLIIYSGRDSVKIYSKDSYRQINAMLASYLLPVVAKYLEILNCMLANVIITNSKDIEPLLETRCHNKIVYMSRFYVDNSVFVCEKNISKRPPVICYAGKFTQMKGLLNLIDAIPIVLEKNNEVKFILIGDGPLKSETISKIKRNGIDEAVSIIGWIPQRKLNDYLNNSKILIISSEAEVGPQILLEAISSGTIVLSTRVGIVPDIILDNVSGFILEKNSPDCIAESLLEILSHEDLDIISKGALELIRKEYSFEAVVNRYMSVFNLI